MAIAQILWVDDEIESLQSQKIFLESKGYAVHTLTNGYDAIEYIPHRTITHWPILWVAVWWYCNTLGGYPAAVGLGVAVGALGHIS